MRVGGLFVAAFVASAAVLVNCGPGECANLGACRVVDEDGDSSDYVIELGEEAVTLTSPTVTGPSVQTVTGGEIVIHPRSTACAIIDGGSAAKRR